MVRWAAVALYTAALPYVILVFEVMDRNLSSTITARLPLLIIGFFAAAYVIMCVKRKTVAYGVVILAVSALIVSVIMLAETNGNKHIHIPQYTLMTWLLYWALAPHYKGRGLLLLIFICAVMLGFVDELLQGLHPRRFYGGPDMAIDAAGAFIGVLMLMGVRKPVYGQWDWAGRLRDYMGSLALILFGAGAAVLMGIRLFDVQRQKAFSPCYPRWLLIGNLLFLVFGAAAIIYHWHRDRGLTTVATETDAVLDDGRAAVRCWIFSLLAILAAMHALVVWAAVGGLNFR